MWQLFCLEHGLDSALGKPQAYAGDHGDEIDEQKVSYHLKGMTIHKLRVLEAPQFGIAKPMKARDDVIGIAGVIATAAGGARDADVFLRAKAVSATAHAARHRGDFQVGKCTRGANCGFIHEKAASATPAAPAALAEPEP